MAEFLPAVIAAHAKVHRLAPIETWLNEGNDPDLRDGYGATLMHYALCSTDTDFPKYSPASLPMVRLLLAHGSDPNHRPFTGADSAGWSALHYAVTDIPASQSLELMVALLDSGARVDVVDVDGEHLLFTCMDELRGKPLRVEAVRLLLSRGASLLAEDEYGRTAEEYAEFMRNNAYDGELYDETWQLLRNVRLAGGWKRYVNAPRANLLILRELCNRGRRAAPPPELAALFCTSSDNARRTRKALPTPVFWHVLGYWRSDRDAIA